MGVHHGVICVFLVVIGIDGKPPSAILGGSDANEGECPYQVALKVWGDHYACSGSIIDSRHILTAAHCIDDEQRDPVDIMTVTTGSNYIWPQTGTVYRIKSFEKNPSYAPSEMWKNDIAILTLTEEIKFDKHTKAIDLPTEDVPGDVVAKASGWGNFFHPNGVTPVNLQKLEMKVIAKGKCILPGHGSVNDGQLCAIAKWGSGLCSGDSGGPLVRDGKIIGVSSFVYPCAVGYPDVFTRVYSYVDWIKRVTRKT